MVFQFTIENIKLKACLILIIIHGKKKLGTFFFFGVVGGGIAGLLHVLYFVHCSPMSQQTLETESFLTFFAFVPFNHMFALFMQQ